MVDRYEDLMARREALLEECWRLLLADPMVRRRASGRRPGPEFLGVEYGPDVLDSVACHVEGQHCRGDAVLLGDQAGLAVDHALQDGEPGCSVGEIDAGA